MTEIKKQSFIKTAADRERFGFTLTEFAIVLGVMSTIVAGIWTVANSVSESRKETDAINQLQIVSQNILAAEDGRLMTACATYIAPNNITPCMIAAGEIPAAYIDPTNPTTAADSPWGAVNSFGQSEFDVWLMTSPAHPRISFYNTTNAGCIALLLAATNCQAGQRGCPIQVATHGLSASQDIVGPSATVGWGILSPTKAASMCADNTNTSVWSNSVEFDYYTQ